MQKLGFRESIKNLVDPVIIVFKRTRVVSFSGIVQEILVVLVFSDKYKKLCMGSAELSG